MRLVATYYCECVGCYAHLVDITTCCKHLVIKWYALLLMVMNISRILQTLSTCHAL